MDIISSLQRQLQSLQDRIKELESENSKLSVQLSNCHCQKSKGNVEATPVLKEIERLKLVGDGGENNSKETSPGPEMRMPPRFHRRYVALKIMYFGQRFYGFASEAQMDPTIESEIFKALKKTRLIVGVDKKEMQYSRCGRTDKGVSSVGQVIALFLRSKQMETSGREEIDYVGILNKVLPNDIRVMGWCPAPNDLSARFSCLSRVYKYFFWRDNLNTQAMETAGKKFVGEHDFRNFCKMDASNVHNYRRRVMLFEIMPCSESFGGDDLWVMKIKGSAFLWHQIRCMAAILFFIGQGLESPNIIDMLLDVENMPRKPQYKMAPEIPLVLQSCEFEGLRFICSSGAKQALCEHLKKECRSYKLQSAIFHEALQNCFFTEADGLLKNDRIKRREPVHVPIMSRPTEPSYEERRAKFKSAAEHKSRNS
ncbi:hypothetical protein M9H77_31835 [Catharanthus roseus]|uniref:Uncharacterized protein n=1 Tax=Catharanthus roseus TaxID=4058 RepID=A0ACC0A3J0_CATRO|nr:hypothetical protein M9H77_31835 [Catharanthus roseus]